MKMSLVPTLLFLGVASRASVLLAQSPGTFRATGSMTTPRAGQAAAQLPGAFTATGNMTMARVGHTATSLANGKVLMAGGGKAGEPRQPYPLPQTVLASAELFDPASGTFASTGDMTTPRIGHTATLLPDGRVLIAGGQGPSTTGNGAVASAELYDPASGTFAPTGDMIQSRLYHAATLLASGKVLIAGGPVAQRPSFTAELYDPSSATFTTVGPLPVNASQLTLLADGKVLMQVTDDEAGFPGVRARINPALYDPLTGAFRLDGESIRDYWTIVTATLLTTGKVLDTMTVTDSGYPTAVAQLYDPSTGVFATRKMAAVRRDATATLLPDATVLIAGGGDSDLGWSNAATSGAELYDPVADKFSITGSMAENREGHTATLLPDGAVLIAGGGINFYGTATAEIYHPNVLIPAAVLFSLSGDGRGPARRRAEAASGAMLHAGTPQVVSPSNPAVVGEAVEIYLTGLIDGAVIPPQVAIGGRMAEVLFFGKAPVWPGLSQINVRVPSGVTPGPSVSVRLNYLNRPSNEVTMAVK